MPELTAWQRHKELVAKAAKGRRTASLRQAERRRTWEDRPLYCRLGIHRPYKQVGLPKNDYALHQCLRCGFEWGGLTY